MNNKEQANSMLERLILMGAVEPCGIDINTGEMLFNFSPDLANISPGLAKHVNDMFSGITMTLWSKGFLELKYESDSLDPTVFLTEKCENQFEISLLPEFERAVLNNIIALFAQDQV